MGKVNLPNLLGVVVFISLAYIVISRATPVRSATASHVVISEIQLSGGTGASTKEFVELYNPTNTSVNLQNWKLSKKNQSGSVEDFLVATMSGSIPSRGFFLIGSQAYNLDASVSADITYATGSASLTDNNTIILYDSENAVVDKVGFGTAADFEGASETNPAAGSSRERKAQGSSTVTSMAIGGADEFNGNGEDTDSNANDFVSRSVPQPQNSSSALEPIEVRTPIGSPTVTPTATPTNTPNESPTAMPTETPAATPRETPEATETPTATPAMTPTQSPVATSTPRPPSVFPRFTFVCKTTLVTFDFGFFRFKLPQISCWPRLAG
jgi:hypothetical protein